MITPEKAVDDINVRFGRHKGFRALHAKGQFLTGSFTATPEAATLCRAAHLQGQAVAVTARFSNGGGDPTVPDYLPDVRGLGVSFHLPDGSRTDIVAQTAPRFPVRSPQGFIDFVKAMEPGLAQLWKLPAFLWRYPEALPGLPVSAGALIRPPASYSSLPYYGVHAFKLTNAQGDSCHVRYRWQPEAEAKLSLLTARKKGADYLQQELRERLQQRPVRMTLLAQVAGPGDDVNDPVAHWPDESRLVTLGTLELTALDTARETDGKPFVFDPVRVTDGIALTDDPILRFRTKAYSVSVARRT